MSATDETIKAELLAILEERIGEANRIKKVDLFRQLKGRLQVHQIGIDERVMRGYIQELRESDGRGCLICATTRDGGGYYMARTRHELEESLSQDVNRVRETARRIKAQRERAGLTLGNVDQLELDI